jgi:DNA modification methylase
MAAPPSALYYGDNLKVLRDYIPDESVDLIYLDPPFNSSRAYNVLFRSHGGQESQAQIEAFDDTWTWSPEAEKQFEALIGGGAPIKVADAMVAMRKLLGTSDVMAYLVMMAPRLVAIREVMKPTASIYLHCDPTASHYLKLVMDAVFGAENFRNEISWKRFSAKNDPLRYGRTRDVILFYTNSQHFTWNVQYGPFEDDYVDANYRYVEEGTGRRYRRDNLTAAKPGGDVDYEWHGQRPYKNRHWAYSRANMDKFLAEGRIEFRSTGMPVYKRYLDEQPGVPLQDTWMDIRLHSGSGERLGYQTQKPLALLERIITASSNAGDVVLDPFCGCGTTVDAAQKLRRRWIGIDITYLAIDLIRKRLYHTYGEGIEGTYRTHGIPTDLAGAGALFAANPFDFERWAVSLLNGQPNERQIGDKGVDGRVRFHADRDRIGTCIVSVKGGHQVNPSMVRELVGSVEQQKAEMGVLVVMATITKGMAEVAAKSGNYEVPFTRANFPRIQIATVSDLLARKPPRMPTAILPYMKAKPFTGDQVDLDL